MKLIYCAFITLVFCSCSNRAVYDSVQNAQRNECLNQQGAEYDKCMRQVNKSFDEYQRDREELLKNK